MKLKSLAWWALGTGALEFFVACSAGSEPTQPTSPGDADASVVDAAQTEPRDQDAQDSSSDASTELPTDGVLSMDPVVVTRGLTKCVQIVYHGSNGVSRKVGREEGVIIESAEGLVEESTTSDCVYHAFRGLKVGSGGVALRWGGATGTGMVDVNDRSISFNANFGVPGEDPAYHGANGELLVGMASTASAYGNVQAVGYDFTDGTLDQSAVDFAISPAADATTSRDSRGRLSLVPNVPGRYTMLATFLGESYPSSRDLLVYDLTGATLMSISQLIYGLPDKGTFGFNKNNNEGNGSSPSVKAFLTSPEACQLNSLWGLFKKGAVEGISAVVPGGTWHVDDYLGEATIAGDKLCVKKPGDVILSYVNGATSQQMAYLLGTDSLSEWNPQVSITTATSTSACGTFSLTAKRTVAGVSESLDFSDSRAYGVSASKPGAPTDYIMTRGTASEFCVGTYGSESFEQNIEFRFAFDDHDPVVRVVAVPQ